MAKMLGQSNLFQEYKVNKLCFHVIDANGPNENASKNSS
jgi:hypothetical protein